MMKKLTALLYLMLPVFAAVAQQYQTYEKTVPASDISKGTVKLEIPAGTLQLKATGTEFLKAKIQYGHPNWKPSTNMAKNSGTADVTLKQESLKESEQGGENKWEVNLSKTTPVNLYLKMGAGESNIDLSNCQVKKLEVEAGAVALNIKMGKSAVNEATIKAGVGEVNLDLTGAWNHNLKLDVAGGIGDIKLKLPKDTGVRLQASGIGSKTINGLRKDGSYYTNAAYGKAKYTLTINVTGGLGSITVSNE